MKATSWTFTTTRPLFLSLDDVVFLHPVEIGSVLEFRAKVVYAPGGEGGVDGVAEGGKGGEKGQREFKSFVVK
ncbi:hypothetical protein HDU93_009646, partial [Gonapodya sp. JEL0774]